MDTFTAISRYDRSKNPTQKEYRFLTLAECKKLHGHADAIGQDGRIARVAITSIKTWKTRPDVRIGWKFGMYEYGQELIISDSDNRFFVTEVPKIYTSYFDRFSIELTKEQALSGSHQGQCDSDIADLLQVPSIKAQLDSIDPVIIRNELKTYGAWEENELQDYEQNQARLLWVACGNIRDDINESSDE